MKEQLTERPAEVDSFGFGEPIDTFDQEFADSEAARITAKYPGDIKTEVEGKDGLVRDVVVRDESAPQTSIPVRVA